MMPNQSKDLGDCGSMEFKIHDDYRTVSVKIFHQINSRMDITDTLQYAYSTLQYTSVRGINKERTKFYWLKTFFYYMTIKFQKGCAGLFSLF